MTAEGRKGTRLSTARDRMKEMRDYRKMSQADFASLLGISHQAYGKKERGLADGFSPEDFVKLLQATRIDARWLFGQMDGPIEKADLKTAPTGREDAADVHALLAAWKGSLSEVEGLAQRLQADPELRECVELLIENRGMVRRAMDYVQGRKDERSERSGLRREENGEQHRPA